MATSTPDSIAENAWMTNIWKRQAWEPMVVALNQKMASILGRVERERTKSTKQSMARNKNMGWWSLCSVHMRKSRTPFPVSARKNMKQKGTEIQMWAALSPGMPAKKKVCGKRWELFKKWKVIILHGRAHRATAKRGRQVRFSDVEIGNSGYLPSLMPTLSLHFSEKKSKINFSLADISASSSNTSYLVGNTWHKNFKNQVTRLYIPQICMIWGNSYNHI